MSLFMSTAAPVKKDKSQEALSEVRVAIRSCQRGLNRQMAQYENVLLKNKEELAKLSKEGDHVGAKLAFKTMKKTERLIDGVRMEIKTSDMLLLEAQRSNVTQRVADMHKRVNKAYVAMDKSISIASIRKVSQDLEKNKEKLSQKNSMVAEASESLRDSIMADDDDGDGADEEGIDEEYEEFLEMQASQQTLSSASAGSKAPDSLSTLLDDLFGPLQAVSATESNNNNKK